MKYCLPVRQRHYQLKHVLTMCQSSTDFNKTLEELAAEGKDLALIVSAIKYSLCVQVSAL